mmetsp:Transcript_4711/g.3364  ORF Transcript_4711/g.3364 Transcript_4711/m.3364 type:complete len:131 (+) Transcript_4711:263-655(+)
MDEYEMLQEMQRQKALQAYKVYFFLRDAYLITKVMVTGTVVFFIKKETKYFLGIDDSTGVVTCVLWLSDFNNQGGQAGKKQQDIRSWMTDHSIGIGSCMSVIGALEFYQQKIQVNVQRFREITDPNEEML